MTSGNQGKMAIHKRLYVFLTGRFPIKEQTEESIKVKALNAQIRSQQSIIAGQTQYIEQLTKKVEFKQNTSMQEEMLQIAKQVLLPQKKQQQEIQKTITSSTNQTPKLKDLSDSEITDMLSQYDSSVIKQALSMGDHYLGKQIKQQYPNISDKSILRGIEIAKGVAQ